MSITNVGTMEDLLCLPPPPPNLHRWVAGWAVVNSWLIATEMASFQFEFHCQTIAVSRVMSMMRRRSRSSQRNAEVNFWSFSIEIAGFVKAVANRDHDC